MDVTIFSYKTHIVSTFPRSIWMRYEMESANEILHQLQLMNQWFKSLQDEVNTLKSERQGKRHGDAIRDNPCSEWQD